MLHRILRKRRRAAATMLDQYVMRRPSAQNALDIFEGEWSSRMPSSHAELTAGAIALFEDERLTWLASHFGGVEGKRVLELGPPEGGHSYMLEQLGAASVFGIEANSRAFLKCLTTKEILGLQRCRYQLGDFVAHLRGSQERYDVCLASGVLYHMSNPAELIALISKVSDRVLLWTHYYDQRVIAGDRSLAHRLAKPKPAEHEGFRHQLYLQRYGRALGWGGFCGGGAQTSNWMSRDDVLGCLRFFGFCDQHVAFDQPDHQNGPAFCVAASA